VRLEFVRGVCATDTQLDAVPPVLAQCPVLKSVDVFFLHLRQSAGVPLPAAPPRPLRKLQVDKQDPHKLTAMRALVPFVSNSA